jgi:hypothetical protein
MILDLEPASNTITGVVCSNDLASFQSWLVLEAMELFSPTEEDTISWAQLNVPRATSREPVD